MCRQEARKITCAVGGRHSPSVLRDLKDSHFCSSVFRTTAASLARQMGFAMKHRMPMAEPPHRKASCDPQGLQQGEAAQQPRAEERPQHSPRDLPSGDGPFRQNTEGSPAPLASQPQHQDLQRSPHQEQVPAVEAVSPEGGPNSAEGASIEDWRRQILADALILCRRQAEVIND